MRVEAEGGGAWKEGQVAECTPKVRQEVKGRVPLRTMLVPRQQYSRELEKAWMRELAFPGMGQRPRPDCQERLATIRRRTYDFSGDTQTTPFNSVSQRRVAVQWWSSPFRIGAEAVTMSLQMGT
jgi:hypothetical protein